MIRTEIYIEDERLDLSKDISTEFTYAIDDIKDFASRNTSFSKTIVIPGNDTNNKLFGHIFKFGSANAYNQGQPNVGYNYNAAKSASCYIYIDKIQIFKGVLRLLEVIIDGDKIEYECAVFGELGGFISALGNSKLEDIDFGIANQNWNELTIADSWNNVSGGGVYYPLILNASGKFVLHNRATYRKGLCKGAHNEGPRIIDQLGDSLVRLFGTGAALSIRSEILAGRDPYFMPPMEIVDAYKNELSLEDSMLPPQPLPRLINP